MKPFIILTALAFTFGASYAQNNAPKKTVNPKTKVNPDRLAIGGTIKDARSRPMAEAEVFVYMADSSITASGYTDAQGRFETNSVAPGTYDVKIVYPNTRATRVTGVIVKKGITQLNVKADEPTEDATMAYADIMPQPAATKKSLHKAK